jgi:thiol-disulfide isomerase/thioredoxin
MYENTKVQVIPASAVTGSDGSYKLTRFGGKPALLEVFSPGCGWCQKVQPVVEFLAKELEQYGLIVAAIDSSDSANQNGPNLAPNGVPAFFFVDASGSVSEIDVGDRSITSFLEVISKKLSMQCTEQKGADGTTTSSIKCSAIGGAGSSRYHGNKKRSHKKHHYKKNGSHKKRRSSRRRSLKRPGSLRSSVPSIRHSLNKTTYWKFTPSMY